MQVNGLSRTSAVAPTQAVARTAPSAPAEVPGSPLLDPAHQSYQVKKRWFSFFGPKYDVYADGEKVGTIAKRGLSLTPTYDIYDSNGQKVVTVSKKLLSFGYDARLKDEKGKDIGKIEQSFGRTLVNPTVAFDVFDASDRRVAKTDPAWLTLSDRIDLKNGAGQTIGNMHNSFSFFRESYSLKVENDLDRRLVLGMLALQINLKDEQKRLEEEEEKEREQTSAQA
jgi:uncharacterized protein YxjI